MRLLIVGVGCVGPLSINLHIVMMSIPYKLSCLFYTHIHVHNKQDYYQGIKGEFVIIGIFLEHK